MAIGRIRKRSEYQHVARQGERVFSPNKEFIMQAVSGEPVDPAPLGNVRIGFVVTRKNGSAVVRNRIRRRLKEACLLALRKYQICFDAPTHVVIVGFRRSADVPFHYLVEAVFQAFTKAQQKLRAKK